MRNSNYSSVTLSVISVLVIGVVLLTGSTVGFFLSERKSLAKLEMQQTMDRYILIQALSVMEGLETSASQEIELLAQLTNICSQIMPDEDELGSVDNQTITISKAFHCAAKSQSKPGWSILHVTNASGYSGDISMVVGLDGFNTLSYLRVLTHSETVGYGTRLLQPGSKWLDGMIGKPRSFFQPIPAARAANREANSTRREEFDAISGATITAGAVTSIIEQSFGGQFIRPSPPGK